MPIVDPWKKGGIVDPWALPQPPEPDYRMGLGETQTDELAFPPLAEGERVPELEIPARALENVPRSAANLAKGVYGLAKDPMALPKHLGRTMAGIQDIVGGKETEEAEAARDIWGHLKERYGGYENIKRTMVEDPVGFGLEVAGAKTLLTPKKVSFNLPEEFVGTHLQKIRHTKIANIVRREFTKAVRPSVAGKANASQVKAFYNKATEGVKSIVRNKENLQFVDDSGVLTKGKLPSTLRQFEESISRGKKAVFQKYTKILEDSGGGTIALDDIATELEAFAGRKVKKIFRKKQANYALEVAADMEGNTITLLEAQEVIAELNQDLLAFYKNPTIETATNAAVDGMVANRLRMKLDSAVEGSGYQALKNEYGALRTIEKDVTHRALVDARKNARGLIDFADLATAAEMAKALTNMSKGNFFSGIAIHAMKRFHKFVNDPNRRIKSMFTEVDSLMKP